MSVEIRKTLSVCLTSLSALIAVSLVVSATAWAAGAPTVAEESFSNVTATEATVSAQIDPGGEPAAYDVEYGTSEQFAATKETGLPASEAPVGALARLTGLAADTEYHFRFVAHSGLGATMGATATFTTLPLGGASRSGLPDGRAYEWVSRAPGNQEVYVPRAKVENITAVGFKQDVFTERPFRASADGDSIAYVAEPSASGSGTGNQGQSFGDEWLAHRGEGQWSASDIQPPNTRPSTEFQAFSSDLATGFITAPKVDHLSGDGVEGCRGLYARDDESGAYHDLVTETQTPGLCGEEHEPVFAGAATDESRTFFQTYAALTPGSVQAPGAGSMDLYESSSAGLRAVNVLPDGEPDPHATFGGPSPAVPEHTFDFDDAVSESGDSAFWTDLSTGIIYVRLNGTRTVQISAGSSPAQYWTASSDGRYAFYTEAERLFRFNMTRFDASAAPESVALEESREELAPEGVSHESPAVNGVVGASRDGSYLYFVAGAVLAENKGAEGEKATPQTCREANGPEEVNQEENVGNLEGGGCNLYVLHLGDAPRFIATLAPKDNNLPIGAGQAGKVGDWRPDLGSRTAEVTPDGRHLVFESRQRLTGYDNGGVKNLELPPDASEREVEIFVYDPDGAGEISCASCDPSGAPPVVFAEHHGASTLMPPSTANAFMRRWINDEGTRVFFDTSQALVPQDTNGAEDVYEWEQNGVGSCAQSVGCTYLLSGGASTDNSFFLDASANGGDVFFVTRERLVAEAGGQKMDLYDAHQCTASAPCPAETGLACTGTACQGVPPAPPIFATPSTATFTGVGNFPPPPPTKPASNAKRLTTAEKLVKALKGCRAKRNRHKRVLCERRARKRYPAVERRHKARGASAKSSQLKGRTQ